MRANQHGQFDSSGRRYIITDHRTPMPWVNVICNGRYGLVVSQRGGGFSFFDNSQMNVLTRWEMDLAQDQHGKYIYLSDLESGEVWSAAPAPCNAAYTSYQCVHEPGVTTITTEYAGIRAEWTISVAPDAAVEIWRLKLINTSGRARSLRVSSFFEWCCGVAPDVKREFHRLFMTTRHDAKRKAIVVHKNMWDVPFKDERLHWNRPWPYVAGHAVHGSFERDLAIGDKRAFLGRGNTIARPAAMSEREFAKPGDLNVFGRFGDAAGALGGDLRLAAGGDTTIVFAMAIAQDEPSLLGLLETYASPKGADAAISGATAMWDGMLSRSTVKSAMPDFDLLNSTWLAYQAISGRLWGRTGYYQQSGAYGFRDQLQDSQVWLPRDPMRTREQIMLHAAHQLADGSVYHWWHPLVEFGNHTLCSDDYLWLAFLTCEYIKDSGDWSILDAKARFVDDATETTLLDHCTRSIARALSRFSERGLPLIGSCDWNDGLSAMGVGGKGESVWLAQWLCVVLRDFARVLEHGSASQPPNKALAAQYQSKRDALARAINALAWDGDSPGGGKWYKAATRDDGRWIGTASDKEGKIFLNTQTWAILSETAPADRADDAWASVKEHLLRPMGPLLSTPAYTEPDATIGYITRYAPGLRENGGVYMHAATWALAAACKRRDVAAVESIWRSISPPLRGQDSEAYWAEPYVTPGNVDGPDSSTPGKAGWTWYTGSAAWLNRVSLEWICGVRPEWEGLRIDPCPPKSLGAVTVTRVWRGHTVRVSFDAGEYIAGLPARVVVNGKEVDGGVIPLPPASMATGDLDVRVSWGVHVMPRGGANGVAKSAGVTTRQ